MGTNTQYHYPSAYEWNIGVGSVNIKKMRSDFSSYGDKVGLEIMAPGEDITVACPGGGYRSASGTSFSAPHVTGAVALLISENRELSPDEIRDYIKSQADVNLPDYNPHEYGAGLLDLRGF